MQRSTSEINNGVSEEEAAELRRQFAQIDVDGSGYIDPEEMDAFL